MHWKIPGKVMFYLNKWNQREIDSEICVNLMTFVISWFISKPKGNFLNMTWEYLWHVMTKLNSVCPSPSLCVYFHDFLHYGILAHNSSSNNLIVMDTLEGSLDYVAFPFSFEVFLI
jgi:hypothetical protein